MRKRLAILGLAAAGFAVGGVAGLTLGAPGLSGAETQTTPPSSPPANGATPAPNAKSGSNEDPTHEAGETPEREAAEDSGQVGHGGPHGTNEDPAHEATESPDREAKEHANSTPNGAAPSTGQTPGSPTAPSGGAYYPRHHVGRNGAPAGGGNV